MKMQEEIVNKKSYNPFKMWGSWVGAGLPLLLTILTLASIKSGKMFETLFRILIILGWPIIYIWGLILKPSGEEGMAIILIAPLSAIIIGFLLGWGIHSLVRRFRK